MLRTSYGVRRIENLKLVPDRDPGSQIENRKIPPNVLARAKKVIR
jgi:hypothetical protein